MNENWEKIKITAIMTKSEVKKLRDFCDKFGDDEIGISHILRVGLHLSKLANCDDFLVSSDSETIQIDC